MIQNPILPGFNPDPCICRKGDDYYMAVSTFEWFPGIPVYHSRDIKNWELYTHVLTDDEEVDLKKLPSAKGIWAPCLTYCEEEEMFYVNALGLHFNAVLYRMFCAVSAHTTSGHDSAFFCEQYHLTKKEGAIFALLLQYKTNEEISDALDITVNTLQKHIQNIFRKTNTTSKWELLRLVSDQTS